MKINKRQQEKLENDLLWIKRINELGILERYKKSFKRSALICRELQKKYKRDVYYCNVEGRGYVIKRINANYIGCLLRKYLHDSRSNIYFKKTNVFKAN